MQGLSLRFLFILALNCLSTFAIVCPENYTDGGDGSCYFFSYAYRRNFAYNLCASNGAYLFDVNNAFDNNKIQQISGWKGYYWLGLTCTSNDKTSCVWDGTGKTLTAQSYSNFYGGSPSLDNGPCVFMRGDNGMWYSADCTNDYAWFGCKYTPGVIVPTCSDYTTYGTFAFRDKCYWATDGTAPYSGAQVFCSMHGGSMVSIHSAGENMFVKSIGRAETGNYIYTGLQTNGNGFYFWSDGSKFDYNNFAYQNISEHCVSLTLMSNIIIPGKWINSDCEITMSTVCKKDALIGLPVTTHPPPLTPSQCSSPQNYSCALPETIYSPGYPYGMDSTSCEFIISVDERFSAQITFHYLFLYEASSLLLYYDMYSTIPFQTLNYTTTRELIHTTFTSTTNMIRMYFNSSYNDGSTWTADFKERSIDQVCTLPMYYKGNGRFYSPEGERINLCEYIVTVDQGENAQIYFSSIFIDNYDLSVSSQLMFYSDMTNFSLIRTLNSNNTYGRTAVVSSTNMIRMIYNNSLGDGTTFIANYGSTDCGKTYFYNGTVTSENYPTLYTRTGGNCSKILNSEGDQTCVIFDVFDIRNGDSVTLYDGYDWAGVVIATFTTDLPATSNRIYCSHRFSYATLVLTSSYFSSDNDHKGFSARFGSTETFLMERRV